MARKSNTTRRGNPVGRPRKYVVRLGWGARGFKAVIPAPTPESAVRRAFGRLLNLDVDFDLGGVQVNVVRKSVMDAMDAAYPVAARLDDQYCPAIALLEGSDTRLRRVLGTILSRRISK